MGDGIILYGFKSMLMHVGGSQFEAAVSAEQIFPFFCMLVRNVGDDLSDSGARSTSAPMSGLISMDDILVRNSRGAEVATTVADFVAIRGVDMIVNICFLVTSGADLPVLGFVLEFFAGGSVSILQIITASFASFQTAVGEVVFFMANTATTVSTACPVIEIIVIPIFTYFVLRGGLLIADAANFLVCILVNIRDIAI